MFRRILLFVLVALLLAAPATAKNTRTVVYSAALTQDDGATAVRVNNPTANSAYLIVSALTESGTASLSVTVENVNAGGSTDTLLCTTTALTAAGTWRVLMGTNLTAAGAISQVCAWPLGALLEITATIADDSGAGTDGFATVTVEFQPLEHTGY